MAHRKILITGTIGSGKTSAVKAMADFPLIKIASTDYNASPKSARIPGTIEVGELELCNGGNVRLLSTPGSKKFDPFWPALAHEALGIILLVNDARPNSLNELTAYLDGFRVSLRWLPCVLGISQMTTSMEEYASLLEKRAQIFPLFSVDTRRRSDTAFLIETLLIQMEAELLHDNCR